MNLKKFLNYVMLKINFYLINLVYNILYFNIYKNINLIYNIMFYSFVKSLKGIIYIKIKIKKIININLIIF